MTFFDSLPPIATHLVVLLVGIFVGAAGQYLGARFTDQRRCSEEKAKAQKRFNAVQALMPALIEEMRVDLTNDKTGTAREFFPYGHGAICAPDPLAMFYDPDKHPNLENMIMVLENNWYVVNVSDAPRYRMTEEFVDLIKG